MTVRLKYATIEPPELFAQTLYAVVVHNCVAVPYSVPFVLPNEIPVGKLVLFNSQEVIAPEPVMLGTSGKSLEAVLLVNVTFSGLYVIPEGTWSITVKLKYATTAPPELFAHTLYEVRVHNWVAVPYSVPLVLPKDIPVGKLVLFNVQEVIAPEPVMLGTNGKSLDAVLFVSVTFSGLYDIPVGTWSITVKLKYATTDPPELLAHTLYDVRVQS